jgi:thiamine-monophosphate kinase
MNEFIIIKKYFKPLSFKNSGAFKLNDDIFFDKKTSACVSVDTYIHGIHFFSNEPTKFLKKILRASISDLYCKGVNPTNYLLSISLNKNLAKSKWLKDFYNILKSEQKKFKINLVGGDTTRSSKLSITFVVIGYSKKKPVLRYGSKINDDIYVTGTISDSYLGLCVLKKNKNFGLLNKYFIKKYYEPDLPVNFSKYLNYFASSSIDISDGIVQDLQHICNQSKLGAFINLNLLPLSKNCKELVKKNKIALKNIFSKGDDYQILFTANSKYRSKILRLSRKSKVKVSRIGQIKKDKNIIFEYNGINIKLNPKNIGYIHKFK